MEEILVGVLCYNHESYIAQCLDSILSQKCDVPYKVYVFDDVSADNSWEIIKEYSEKYADQLIVEQPEHNTYSSGNRNAFLQHMQKICRAEYITFCEADDFWTDENKLQRQYAAMKQDQDAVMCVHDVELINVVNGDSMGVVPGDMGEKWSQRELVTRLLTYRISFRINGCMIRNRILAETDLYGDFWDFWAIDLALFTYAALRGKVIYLHSTMAAKRVNNAGSLSRQANLEEHECRHQIDMFEEDIRWIERFEKLSQGEYENLTAYYRLFRKIKLYYLYRGNLKYNKLVSNANGKMYTHEYARKVNRFYVRLVRKLCGDNECKFVVHSRKWMEKEWKRLQNLS